MATNKWLNDLQILKSTTDILRTTLRNKNVRALDTDTLPTLVSKVPDLAPIVESEDDNWQPDSLWKFPDPNGTDTLKTIREIYDEDALASSYTYRGIYQIRGDLDTIDLKAVMGKRTKADTFILSDGTTYENITATTLQHTWDKSKDVIDSKGNRQRYVRVYTNTINNFVPGFYGQLVWCVNNLGVNSASMLNVGSGIAANITYSENVECIEYGDKYTDLGTVGDFYSELINLKRISFDNKEMIVYWGSVLNNTPLLKNIDVEITQISGYGYQFLNNSGVKSITLSQNNYKSTAFSVTPSDSSRYNHSIEKIINLDIIPVTTVNINNYTKLKSLLLPNTVTSVALNGLYHIKELIIPEKVTSLTIKYLYLLKNITILTSVLTSFSFDNLAYSLETINVQLDWNFAINLSNSHLLKHDSIVNLLENLKDLTGDTAKTLTLGSTNLAKLTDEEKAIATNKNWTLA